MPGSVFVYVVVGLRMSLLACGSRGVGGVQFSDSQGALLWFGALFPCYTLS